MNQNSEPHSPAEAANQLASEIPNGAAAAAILAAGLGCFFVALFAWLGDAVSALKQFFNFYNPTGPLSGVTTTAITLWILAWIVLARLWDGKQVSLRKVNIVSFLLLGSAFLLTFPPFGDFLQGK